MYKSATHVRPVRTATTAITGSTGSTRSTGSIVTVEFFQSLQGIGTAADPAAPDPAGGIVLSGRNRIGERSRVMAGLFLTTGVVAALTQLDTAVSLHGV